MGKRNVQVDVMKGVAIILMVIGHSHISYYGTKVIYLFHMPLFFMISGYLFKMPDDPSIKWFLNYILKKIKGLWIPCFFWNLVYSLLNNWFIRLHIYSEQQFEAFGGNASKHDILNVGAVGKNIARGLVMSGHTEMGGAFWFLKTLFAVSIAFALIQIFLHRIKDKVSDGLNLLVAILSVTVGWLAKTKGIVFLGLPIVCSSYIFFYIGYVIKTKEIMEKVVVSKLLKFICLLVSVLILTIATIWMPSVSIADNAYWNPIYVVLTSLSGWFLIYYSSAIVTRMKIAKLLKVIGTNTMSIVVLHFLCFKLVSLVQIWVYKHPIDYLALFPVFTTHYLWWIPYTIVGVGLPIILKIVYDRTKCIFTRRVIDRS